MAQCFKFDAVVPPLVREFKDRVTSELGGGWVGQTHADVPKTQNFVLNVSDASQHDAPKHLPAAHDWTNTTSAALRVFKSDQHCHLFVNFTLFSKNS